MNETKHYATLNNPTIQAVTHALFRFPTAEDAIHQMENLQRHFIIAKKQIKNAAHPSLILWIKGYALTPEDEPKGVIGHYAIVSYKEVDGKFTLFATKMEGDHREHPQRKLVMRDQPPNWGHPVLRHAMKGRTYTTGEEAQAQLALLHEHYPNLSIPTPGKLYIMIYCSRRPATQRMVKHIVEIKVNDEGRYRLDIKENIPKKKAPVTTVSAPAASEPPHPQGVHTAKVMLRRQTKARKPKAKIESKNSGTAN
jgi:hypothetical protein